MTTNTFPKQNSITNANLEADLIVRAANGECSAFDVIMHRHNRLLFRVARSILKNNTEAEDTLKSAYVSAWQALSTFRAGTKLSTWLVHVVVDEALSRLSSKSVELPPLTVSMTSTDSGIRSPVIAESETQLGNWPLNAKLRCLLEVSIDKLPDAFRTILILCAVEEMEIFEVALALGIPEAVVRTRLYCGISFLREEHQILYHAMDINLPYLFSLEEALSDRIVLSVMARIMK